MGLSADRYVEATVAATTSSLEVNLPGKEVRVTITGGTATSTCGAATVVGDAPSLLSLVLTGGSASESSEDYRIGIRRRLVPHGHRKIDIRLRGEQGRTGDVVWTLDRRRLHGLVLKRTTPDPVLLIDDWRRPTKPLVLSEATDFDVAWCGYFLGSGLLNFTHLFPLN